MDFRDDIKIDYDIEPLRERRPRKKKSRVAGFFKRVNVVICALTFLTVSVGMLLLERPTVSETENRNLAKFPEFSWTDYFSGKYTADIENYYNDTVPGREDFKHMTAEIRDNFGMQSEEVKIYGTPVVQDKRPEAVAEVVTEAPTEAPTEAAAKVTAVTKATKPVTTTVVTTTTDPMDDPNIEGELSNNILVYKNRGIMLFGGSYSRGEQYAQYLNNFKNDLGINVYSMVCPTPVSYYLPKKYSDLSASEEDNIANINEFLDGVTPVDAYGALKEHKDEDIFMRTDHHWSQLGAYYAAEEFAKEAGVPFAELDSYEKVQKEGYVGTLYGYSGDADLKDNPETFTYYKPTNEYTTTYYDVDMTNEREGKLLINIDNVDPVSWYLVFIGTDMAVTHVHTDVANGRKLAIVKDSYGNALVPCLTGSFEDIYVVDMRYLEVNAVSLFREWGITDLLFAMNTFSATGKNSEGIERIRIQ